MSKVKMMMTIGMFVSKMDAKSEIDEEAWSTNIFVVWNKRKEKLEHDYAITAWSLSLLPEICSDVSTSFDEKKKLIVEHIIQKLHHPPCSNHNITTIAEIFDIYWKEYRDFD